MEITELIVFLKNKYNYSDELVLFLEKSIPALVQYYGEDKKELIFNTLSECPIHIQKEEENYEDYLNEYFNTNKKRNLPFLGAAALSHNFYLEGEELKNKSIIYIITRSLGGQHYTPFDFNNDENVAVLIHEICHAIKEYNQVYWENGHAVLKSGLMKHTSFYDMEANEFKFVKASNVGLEEALNSYDEQEIMSILKGRPYDKTGYGTMLVFAKKLMEIPGLKEALKISQFTDKEEWIEILGAEEAALLSRYFDDWVNIIYISPSEVLKEGKESIIKRRNEAIDNIDSFIAKHVASNHANKTR